MRINIHTIWVPLFAVFVLEKLWFEKYNPAQVVISFLFFLMSVFWFIAPYILGDDIRVPGYSDILKKGSDDILRFVYLVVGIIGYIGSLLI